MPCPTYGAVTDDLAWLGIKLPDDLVDHHWYVPIFFCQDALPYSENINSSRSWSSSSICSLKLDESQISKWSILPTIATSRSIPHLAIS